jgi:chitin disaccharide deacetylase
MTDALASESLAERLGGVADDRILIVNCDDLGSSHSANVAIEDCLRRGVATSATLMVPCPWAFEAAVRLKGAGIGVHLTLTAEYPRYRWRSLTGAKSLHDADGFLPRTAAEVFAKASLDDARAECRAQIDQALAWGVDVTHLDSHMGTVQTEPRFFGLYLELAAEYDLPLRMVGQAGERALGFASRDPAAEQGLVFTDHFLSPTWGMQTREVILRTLPQLRPGVTEVYLHPVVDSPELRAYDEEAADVRAGDYALLMDDELRTLIEAEHVRLISFRPLRELQSGR